MIIYNVTVKVEEAIAEPWLDWMLQEHIPAVMATGCFESFQVVKLLEVDDTEGPTYAVQYRAASKADYNRYIELNAEGLRQQSFDRWGQRFIAFRSLMQVVR